MSKELLNPNFSLNGTNWNNMRKNQYIDVNVKGTNKIVRFSKSELKDMFIAMAKNQRMSRHNFLQNPYTRNPDDNLLNKTNVRKYLMEEANINMKKVDINTTNKSAGAIIQRLMEVANEPPYLIDPVKNVFNSKNAIAKNETAIIFKTFANQYKYTPNVSDLKSMSKSMVAFYKFLLDKFVNPKDTINKQAKSVRDVNNLMTSLFIELKQVYGYLQQIKQTNKVKTIIRQMANSGNSRVKLMNAATKLTREPNNEYVNWDAITILINELSPPPSNNNAKRDPTTRFLLEFVQPRIHNGLPVENIDEAIISARNMMVTENVNFNMVNREWQLIRPMLLQQNRTRNRDALMTVNRTPNNTVSNARTPLQPRRLNFNNNNNVTSNNRSPLQPRRLNFNNNTTASTARTSPQPGRANNNNREEHTAAVIKIYKNDFVNKNRNINEFLTETESMGNNNSNYYNLENKFPRANFEKAEKAIIKMLANKVRVINRRIPYNMRTIQSGNFSESQLQFLVNRGITRNTINILKWRKITEPNKVIKYLFPNSN